MKILIGTRNRHKLREYQDLFRELPVELISPELIALADVDVEENGETFEANAAIKATAYAHLSGMPALADDSGLMVDALGGAPGVHSARFGGASLADTGKRLLLLAALAGVPAHRRRATFVCVIAIALPDASAPKLVRGECAGSITDRALDAGQGFGYDLLFQPYGFERTFGQMSASEKNGISHRSIAANRAIAILREMVASAKP